MLRVRSPWKNICGGAILVFLRSAILNEEKAVGTRLFLTGMSGMSKRPGFVSHRTPNTQLR